MQIKGDAHPCAPHWEAYCHYRERQLVLTAPSAFRAKVRRQQPGRCPRCQQMLQDAESLALHDQDGNHQNNRRVTLVL